MKRNGGAVSPPSIPRFRVVLKPPTSLPDHNPTLAFSFHSPIPFYQMCLAILGWWAGGLEIKLPLFLRLPHGRWTQCPILLDSFSICKYREGGFCAFSFSSRRPQKNREMLQILAREDTQAQKSLKGREKQDKPPGRSSGGHHPVRLSFRREVIMQI